jgi:hypothetical protein
VMALVATAAASFIRYTAPAPVTVARVPPAPVPAALIPEAETAS